MVQVILLIVVRFIITVIILVYLSYTLTSKYEACACMNASINHIHLVDDVFC